jgi:hypothetical protein
VAVSSESGDRSASNPSAKPAGAAGMSPAGAGSIGPHFTSQAFIGSLSGPGQLQQRIILAGAALGVLGSFLPFATMNLPAGMGSMGSYSFLNTGLPGTLALIVAVALGALAIMPGAPSRLNLYGWGLATLVLGMLVYAVTAVPLVPGGQGAAMLESRGIGFYLLLLGYVLLEYGYIQRLPR